MNVFFEDEPALLGTRASLDPDERARIVGFAINMFRGDFALLTLK